MSSASPEILHDKFRIWLRPDGICENVWAPHVRIELEDALAVIDALTELAPGRSAPLLVHTADAGPQSREARMAFVARPDMVSAVALLVGNPLSRMMATFFINVSRPDVPTRLFEDQEAAVAWLKEHLDAA